MAYACFGRIEISRPASERLIVLEFGDVVDGYGRDVQQGFSREKSLVAGDNHIWKREQPRKHFVAKDQPRTILKKDFFFLFVHVKAEVTDFTAL
jgi:hypothetical protein